MVINENKYMIVTKDFPLLFHGGSGVMIEEFDGVAFANTEEEIAEVLSTFDEPEDYRIVKVNVQYEF